MHRGVMHNSMTNLYGFYGKRIDNFFYLGYCSHENRKGEEPSTQIRRNTQARSAGLIQNAVRSMTCSTRESNPLDD